MSTRIRTCALLVAIVALSVSLVAQTPAKPKPAARAAAAKPIVTDRFVYQRAPEVIRKALDTQPTPQAIVSPSRDRMLLVSSLRQPPISDLAAPMLRIAGLRLNPATNGPHHPRHDVGYTLVTIADGAQKRIELPPNAWLTLPQWSADGKHFAFSNYTANTIELWVGDAESGAARKLTGIAVNGTYGRSVQWMPDQKTLLVELVRADRGPAPRAPNVPTGPNAQESAGKPAPIRTFEDLLKDQHDQDLFDYYCTAQLALVDIATGKVTPVGKPAIFADINPSPDGKHILVGRVHKPYSYLIPAQEFPRTVEIWDPTGKSEHLVVEAPSREGVPIEGVPTGPRSYGWRATAPATLVWAEALDGGDPRKKAALRDRIVGLAAPFKGEPVELVKSQFRVGGGFGGGGGGGGQFAGLVRWGANGLGIFSDTDRDRRWTRTLAINADQPGSEPRVLWERSQRDRYGDLGTPLMRTLPSGERVLAQTGDSILLEGNGATAKGEFPFLARFNLKTLKSERIFTSADGTYESVSALVNEDGSRFITRYETPADVPNYYLRTAGGDKRQLTKFADPAPALRGITKQIVEYKRADGVSLNATLYLPPECGSAKADPAIACRKAGERLPTIVWAYPLEFNDADTAGQISGSANRFTTITGYSHLWLLTQGYAVMDNATMPVIGDPETMNNTYIEQIVASAKGAIDKADEMGFGDRNRVGVGGHSYGAFMTANLLAHSDLFRGGVARSGAYNRTLTPFGFQSERRTYWEAPEMYNKVSPFMFANKIRTPILLIHGEADDNQGTFPIQSERMYQAIKGNGGTVRYVTLPYEAHGYQARETTEHVIWEMINWFDRFVKNPPGTGTKVAGN